jgi:hypothetical protein
MPQRKFQVLPGPVCYRPLLLKFFGAGRAEDKCDRHAPLIEVCSRHPAFSRDFDSRRLKGSRSLVPVCRDCEVVAMSNLNLTPLRQLIPGAPATIECTRLRAWLSPAACATNFARGRYHQCVGCAIGCENAGLDAALRESLRRKPCYRCVRTGGRLVRGLCISCYNREREVLAGVNAKGCFPTVAARSLRCLTATVAGEMATTESSRRAFGAPMPRFRACAGGGIVTMLCTGLDEFDRWLRWFHPEARLVDATLLPLAPGREQIADARIPWPALEAADKQKDRRAALDPKGRLGAT